MLKKLLILILITIIILFTFSVKVQANYAIMPLATTTLDGYAYRYCNRVDYDEATNIYTYEYRAYNGGGMYSGTFNVSGEIIDGTTSYVIMLDNAGTVELYHYLDPGNKPNAYIGGSGRFAWQTHDERLFNTNIYRYDVSSEAFELEGTYNFTYYNKDLYNMHADSILLTNVDVIYRPNGLSKEPRFFIFVCS